MVSAWPLATFDHRLAMRFLRVYTHPIDNVFEAVSTGAQLDVWMLPECRVERRLSGAWSMSFAHTDPAKAISGMILVWNPPLLVDYGGMRFELQALSNGGARLDFILSFNPGADLQPENYPGGDQPAGPDTPWRPGVLAGFHLMLDGLAGYLAGRPETAPREAGWQALRGGPASAASDAMTEVYRRHITANCPRR